MDQQVILLKPHIRTMKKDIKRLRELDALKTSQKIIETINKPQAVPAPAPALAPTTKTPTPAIKTQEIPQKIPASTVGSLEKAEQYASEEERQKIFLLKSRKADAEKELAQLQKEVAMLAPQKTKLETEKKTWQDKLNPILEQEKTAPENQKDALEKQKWPIEKAVADAASNLARLNQNLETINQKISSVKTRLADAESNLQELYGNALRRNVEKKREESILPKPSPQPTTPQPSFKEKVQAMNQRDQDQRKKFLEDIEAWAQSDKK